MLNVLPPDEALALLLRRFEKNKMAAESVPLSAALGRVLAEDVLAEADVPEFDRSTVDGYAVRARDTFGCSDSLPAMLRLDGEVAMGCAAPKLRSGGCLYIPTGGALPELADAAVMIEHTQRLPDGTVLIQKPVAPGQNLIYRGDDARRGDTVLKSGQRLRPHDIGALAAVGAANIMAARRPVIGILSTGDELVGAGESLRSGQMRDVNLPMLSALVCEAGGEARGYGICGDGDGELRLKLEKMAAECDMLLVSGGSSAGERDAVERTVAQLGEMLFHGLAIKPGKPTVGGCISGRPVLGLPGHPVAAKIVFKRLAEPLIGCLMAMRPEAKRTVSAVLGSAVPSNGGREQWVAVRLSAGVAEPVFSKSGLITQLTGADGLLRVPREREGIPALERVEIEPL